MTAITEILGEEAAYLLGHSCVAIPRAGLQLPGPDFIDLAQALRTAVINKRAGGMGVIAGRKAFQKPLGEGVALLHAIQDVYRDASVTIA